MSVILGSGEHRYRVVEDWAKLPDGWEFRDVAAVAVDSKDQVYVFNRGEHPMIVFDREGNFLRSWGERPSTLAPTASISARDETLYLTDDGSHTVRPLHPGRQGADDARRSRHPGALHEQRAVPPLHPHRALAGRAPVRLRRLRQRLRPQVLARRQAREDLGRERDRPRTVQYRPQHHRRRRWLDLCGRPREPPCPGLRHRGALRDAVEQSPPALRPVHAEGLVSALLHRGARARHGPSTATPRISGPRLSIVTHEGELVARLGGEEGAGQEPGKFLAPHGLTVDSRGDIYVGEVSYTGWPSIYGERELPRFLRSLQKLEKV